MSVDSMRGMYYICYFVSKDGDPDVYPPNFIPGQIIEHVSGTIFLCDTSPFQKSDIKSYSLIDMRDPRFTSTIFYPTRKDFDNTIEMYREGIKRRAEHATEIKERESMSEDELAPFFAQVEGHIKGAKEYFKNLTK